ncbi:MAG: hypothetical protein WAT19_01615 [Ferruginibacter sp.]
MNLLLSKQSFELPFALPGSGNNLQLLAVGGMFLKMIHNVNATNKAFDLHN